MEFRTQGKMQSCLRNHPKATQLLMTASLFKGQKKHNNWRFEALATMMVLVGVMLTLVISFRRLNSLDTSSAFLVSTVHNDEQICINITCGGVYCKFTQPLGCDATQKFLHTDEIGTFCNLKENCNWNAEIVTAVNLENRSRSLYVITESGKPRYFPPLQQKKLQDVDIVKYVRTDKRIVTVDWTITENARATAMNNCGSATFSQSDMWRCGGYNIYLANVVYTSEAEQKYQQEQGMIMFGVLSSFGGLYTLFAFLSASYGNYRDFKEDVEGKTK
jgi:hypothetical protein